MKNPTPSDFTLEDILPHRGDMLLVSRIVEVDSSHATTLCRIKRSWPLAGEQGVQALVLTEVAAQTAGVCNGWDRIQSRGLDSEKMGWLVGIKKAAVFIDWLPFDAEIVARAENTHNYGNLREVRCQQHLGDRLVGSFTLQLFQEWEK